MARPAAYDAAIDEILGVRPPAAAAPTASTPAPGTTDPMERGFRGWYEGYAKRYGLNPDPDDPQHHYDYRAAFQAGASPDKSGHWPSQFKREGHPNLVVDGKDTRTGQPMAARQKSYDGAVDEILDGLARPQTPVTPEYPSWLSHVGPALQDQAGRIWEGGKEYLTERGGAALRAAGDVYSAPSAGKKMLERATGREPVFGQEKGPRTFEQYAAHLNPTPYLVMGAEGVARTLQAFGAGVAELGPDQAKKLTEALASNAPFLFMGPKPKVPPAPPGPPRLALPGRTTPQLALPPFQPPGLTTRLPQGPLPTPGGFGPVQGPQGVQPPLALPPAPLRLQPPSIGQEALDRLRTKFPGKRATAATEDVPIHAIDATRGKTELLDQHGRPVVGEPGTMPERERLRTLYKGRLGASQLPENERLEGRMQEVVKEAGGHYQGIQYIKGRPQFVLFADDPQTGSTIYLPIDQATPQMVRQRLAAKAREMAAPPGPSTKEVERAYKASGMKPYGEEPPPTSSGEASLPKASPPGPSPAGPSPAFTAPTATGSVLQKSPFYEKTKLGQQAMIPGAEQRAIPTGKLQAQGPQAGTEGTLFEKPTTAVQQPLEAPKPPVQRGQYYGATVDTGTVRLTDPEELRVFLRQQGGIKPDSPGLDVQAAPKEFLSPKGRPFDELVQEVAEAQGRKPKDVEREINRTLSRYGTFRQEMKAEGLMTEIRAAAPPDDIKASIPLEEWRGMGPSDRRAAIEWYRDVFADTERETGMPPIGGGSDGGSIPKRRAAAQALDDLRAVFAPASRGPTAEKMAGILRPNLAELAKKTERAHETLKRWERWMDRLPESTHYAYIDALESGRTPRAGSAAETLKRLLTERRTDVQNLGTGKLENFIEDYFPHLWKDPTQAADAFAQAYGRRPLGGTGAFLKQRTIPTVKEGVALGLEPVTTNPVTATLLKLREMDRYVMSQNILQEMKDAGLARLVAHEERAPAGWTRIHDKIGRAGGAGQYWAPEPAARLLNNHLAPGLQGNVIFDAYRGLGNTLNQMQLGFSAFHLGFVSFDVMQSRVALGLENLFAGRPITAARHVLSAPATPITSVFQGSKVLREYFSPGSQGQEIAAVVEQLIQGGGRARMDRFYGGTAIDGFFKALRQGQYGRALVKSFPATMEAISKPVMEWYVPRAKLGVFADLARFELSRLPAGASRADTVRVLGRAWDSVENRLGQLTYDNLFWNRMLKDGLMASIRSVGWNLGTIRELGGGITDTAWQAGRLLRGRSFEMTPRMAYTATLPFITALFGGIYHYLATGQGPETLKDYFFPRTGSQRPDGSEDRVSLPNYFKDVVAYARHPWTTVKHKLSPTVSLLGEMLENKDYFGALIRNPDDPLVQQMIDAADHVLGSAESFSVRSYLQRRESGATPLEAAQGFAGIVPAPADLVRTPEAQAALERRINRQGLRKKLREEVQHPGALKMIEEWIRD